MTTVTTPRLSRVQRQPCALPDSASFHCATLAALVQRFNVRTPGLLTLTCLLVVATANAKVNYAVSGNTAYVTSSPNASGDIVIASTYNGFPVTYIASEAFSRCTNLTSMTIPNSVTTIGASAFSYCASLTNLSVAAANPIYSSVDGVLFNKAQTTLVIFPPGRDGSYVIPDTITLVTSDAFRNCTNLTQVIIPASVPNIGDMAFSGCTSLTKVIIGYSVTNIGDYAFQDCRSLTGMTIPANVVNIGVLALYGCTRLTNFTFLGNAPGLADEGFGFFNVSPGAKAYYYCGTSGWGATYGGLPTVMLCPPQIAPGSAGERLGGFGFTVRTLTNQSVVVEASANLLDWQPIWTNTLPGTSTDFVDAQSTNNPPLLSRAVELKAGAEWLNFKGEGSSNGVDLMQSTPWP